MGLLKGGREIKWSTVGGIASGWVTTPIIAALVSFICLFFMQNVFMQETYKSVQYQLTPEAQMVMSKSEIETGRASDFIEFSGKIN